MSDEARGGGQEPLLSQEETDALLGAMRAGDSGPEASPIDLTATDRPLKQALERADQVAEVFSGAVTRPILRVLGCTSDAREEPCEVIPFSVLSSALDPGAAITTLRTGDGSLAICVLGPSLVTFVLDCQMGAPLDPSDDPAQPVETLSKVDRRVLRPFLETVVESFSDCWAGDPHALSVDEVLGRPRDLPAFGQFEPLLRFVCKVTPRGCPPGDLMFALTAQAVAATAPRKSASQTRASSTTDRAKMGARLAATHVECVSLLGKALSTVADVLALEPGDVIRLESVPGQPVILTAGATVFAHGHPVTQHGNLAIEITSSS